MVFSYLRSSAFISVHPWFEFLMLSRSVLVEEEPRMDADEHGLNFGTDGLFLSAFIRVHLWFEFLMLRRSVLVEEEPRIDGDERGSDSETDVFFLVVVIGYSEC